MMTAIARRGGGRTGQGSPVGLASRRSSAPRSSVSRWWGAAVMAGLLVSGITACSSSGTSSGSSAPAPAVTNGTAAPGGSSADAVAAAKADLAQLYAGTNKAPDGDPVAAQKGKKVFVISCGQQASGCSVP